MPNMTPIFIRIWLMKIMDVMVLLIVPVNLRIAWDIKRACSPIWESPISPSISARGTSAATESITTISMAPLLTSMSAISSACSPVSGWATSRSSQLTPNFLAYTVSRACSASINAAIPSFFCASATACKARVVLPDASGPYISITLPRGKPPIPSALSRASELVEITGTSTTGRLPSFIMDPLPNWRSTWDIAVSNAFSLSGEIVIKPSSWLDKIVINNSWFR